MGRQTDDVELLTQEWNQRGGWARCAVPWGRHLEAGDASKEEHHVTAELAPRVTADATPRASSFAKKWGEMATWPEEVTDVTGLEG